MAENSLQAECQQLATRVGALREHDFARPYEALLRQWQAELSKPLPDPTRVQSGMKRLQRELSEMVRQLDGLVQSINGVLN